jgi:hypothetical protein
MVRQDKEGKAHTAFLVLVWEVPEHIAAEIMTHPQDTLNQSLQFFWKQQEDKDKQEGTSSFSAKRFPASFYDGSEAASAAGASTAAGGATTEERAGGASGGDASSGESAETAAGSSAAASAPRSAAAAPFASPVPAPANSHQQQDLPGVTYQEAVAMRSRLSELQAQVLTMQGRTDGLNRALQNRDEELAVSD